jgi:hypothetical protein
LTALAAKHPQVRIARRPATWPRLILIGLEARPTYLLTSI